MSVAQRDRDRDRDGGGRGYTIRRYRIDDNDDVKSVRSSRSVKSSVKESRDKEAGRREPAVVREVKEIRIERDIEREPRREPESRGNQKDREEEPTHRELEVRLVEREVERPQPARDQRSERELVRAPSPPAERTYVQERVIERESDRFPVREGYDLERYIRSVDYYAPQPIVIRQEPQQIIIREAPRQPVIYERERPRYEMVEREEVREDRALTRREEPPPPAPTPSRRRDEEDYYYERTTREVDRGPKRDGGSDQLEERDNRSRRDIDPRDSASQHPDDRYSSDEEVYYSRKEKVVERSRSGSDSHRRHLAEGAIAGIGAAEILRHHRKRQGEDPGHRGRNLVGSAALGAVGAEAITRARSKVRSIRGSRSRSSSSGRGGYARARSKHRKHRSRSASRSRSGSKSRARQLGSVAAVAAVGALAGYALRKKNKQQLLIERRSRSRHRRGSIDEIIEARPGAAPVGGPKKSSNRIAQAGLATAAAAGLLQRFRSQSRGGKRNKSQSRVRTGVPIAAAGLGGAAVAGLYERTKARKGANRSEPRARSMSRSLSRSRSRSRSRSVARSGNSHARGLSSDPALIEYGGDPIYPEEPGEYRRRHRGSSSDSSPDRRRRRSSTRSRSRSRGNGNGNGVRDGLLAAGVAGAAAHSVTKNRERKKADKERRRREREEENYNANQAPYSPPPMGANADYAPREEYYPQSNSFPPPPANNEYANPADQYPPYNPADYPPPPGATPQFGQEQYPPPPHDGYGYAPNETFAGDQRYDTYDHDHDHDQHNRRGRDNMG